MSKVEIIPAQISDRIVSQLVWPVLWRLNHVDAVSAMKLVEFIGVADNKVHRTPSGRGRALLQKHLKVTKVQTCSCRRVALGESEPEAELSGLELGGGDIADRRGRVVLFASMCGLMGLLIEIIFLGL